MGQAAVLTLALFLASLSLRLVMSDVPLAAFLLIILAPALLWGISMTAADRFWDRTPS